MIIRSVVAALCAAALCAQPVSAANFPSRPIKIIVPYAAGGGSDLATRLFAVPLSRALGVPVLVVNQGGGGGLVGTASYVRQDPDGYTLLLGAVGALAIIPAQQHVNYDPEKDFIALGSVWQSPQMLAVRKDLGVHDFAGFLAKAKATPIPLTIGDAGTGSLTNMAYKLLQKEAHTKFTNVSYKSGGEELDDILGGHIDAIFAEAPVIQGDAAAGAIIPLAAASSQRSPLLPNVPSATELGYPNLQAVAWYGLVVSAETPAPVVDVLKRAVLAAQKDGTYAAQVTMHGGTIGELGSGPFASLIRSECEKWGQIVRETGAAPK